MKYQSVQDILPEKLIAEIQNYIEGTVLYIPTRKKNVMGRKVWHQGIYKRAK